jgi:hypothetical protein
MNWLKFWNKVIVTLLRLLGRSKSDYPKSMLDKTRENFKNRIDKHNKS